MVTTACRVVSLLLVLLVVGPAARAADRPNVVMIVSDDQAWTDFGFMGHQVIQTPNLDRLAANSAVFLNGYVPTSLCRASLASMLTGLYAHQHRICCNDLAKGVDRNTWLPLMRNTPTVPRMLKEAGYRSLQTGKFWEGDYANGGFTHGMTENKVGGRHGDKGLVIGRQTMKPIFDFIDQRGTQPFFIWYAPMMPHNPHNPPERILNKYATQGRNIQLAKYWAMCEWFDETCGQLLDYLAAKGLRDNTLVVFVVDNGWIQDTRPEGGNQSLPTPKSKRSPYDGGVRTPVLLSWPGHIKTGRHEDLVSSIDLAPTILAACGLRPTKDMPGENLLDVVAGKSPLQRKAVFGEIFVHTAVADDPPGNLTHRWVRQGDFKLIVPKDPQSKPELYNLAKDPYEDQDLAAAHPDQVQQLTKLLDEWWDGR